MEQNTTATEPVVDSDKKKDGKGWKITTLIVSIAAVCGIGFSIYSMVQSAQKDNQISDLKAQIKNNNETVTTTEAAKDEATTNNDANVTTTDPTSKNESSNNYIYIGDWGIKIKIPENLIIIHYNFTNRGYGKTCSSVSVSAVTTSDGIENVDNWDYPMGVIMRCSTNDEFPYGSLVFSNDEYNYYYSFPNGLSTGDPQWIHNGVYLIKDVLTNVDNYSKF